MKYLLFRYLNNAVFFFNQLIVRFDGQEPGLLVDVISYSDRRRERERAREDRKREVYASSFSGCCVGIPELCCSRPREILQREQ